MAASARLRFRRHLALCVSSLLVGEILGQYLAAERPLPEAGEPNPARLTRVKLAWALEVEAGSGNGNGSGGGSESGPAEEAIYQYDTKDDTNIFLQFFNQLQEHLPVIDLNYTLNASEDLAMSPMDVEVENYFKEQWPPGNSTVDELQLWAVKATLRTAPIPFHTSWGYETREAAKLASYPIQSDELCAAQLAHLEQRLERALAQGAQLQTPPRQPAGGALSATPVENFEARQIYNSKDVDLFRYLDTFGRVPSDNLRGNVKWFGSYLGCMSTRLRSIRATKVNNDFWHRMTDQQALARRQAIKFRYCMGALKSHSWLQREKAEESELKSYDYGVTTLDHRLHNYFIRVGMCLPEACDSTALERSENQRAIERLSKFALAKPFNSDHYKFTQLYCLPDERSPLRTIPLLGKLLLVAVLAWLALIGLATMIHLNVDKFYTKTVELIRRDKSEAVSAAATAGQKRQQQTSAHSTSGSGSDNDLADELDQLRASSSNELGGSKEARNQFEEADFLQLKLNWIKLNVWARDKARSLVPGVDLIECLSLYSNWLKYTRRVKLAVVRLYAHEQLSERKLKRNERLLPARDLARAAAAAHSGTSAGDKLNGGSAAAAKDPQQQQPARSREQLRMEEEMERRAAAGRRQLARWQDDDKLEAALDLLLASGRAGTMEANSQLRSAATPTRVDTSSLNALKVIALLWIIAGHCLYYLGSVVGNGALLMLYTNRFSSFALANGAIYITELFFVVTGCLTAYLAFKYNTRLVRVTAGQHEDSLEMVSQREHSKAAQVAAGEAAQEKQLMEPRMFGLPFWALVTANRYLRIVPTYLFVYAAIKLVSIYVGGEGNLWDYAVSPNSVRKACAQESWLPVLTLSTNLLEVHKHCIVGGWYLSVDFQFALMAVPLLIILAQSQRAGPKWLGLSGRLSEKTLAAAGEEGAKKQQQQQRAGDGSRRVVAQASRRVAAAYAIIFAAASVSALLSILYAIFKSHVDLSVILKFTPHQVAMLSQNISMYTNSIFRFRAFAFGLIAGHLLYMYEFKLINLPKLVQLHGTKLTAAIFITGFCIMFVPVLYPMGKIKISHDVISIFTVLIASGIDIFICSLIFLVCIGKAPKAVLFVLNSPFWSIFSALSLSAFLLHTEVIVLLTSQYDPPPNTTWATLLLLFCSTVMITYTLALGLYLTFEMPVGRLIDAIMRSYVLKWQPFKSQINTDNQELEVEVDAEERSRRR